MDNLNENQRQGVVTTKGPVLILAGAGSGKTRVLTERVAYLIGNEGVNPWNIMAITFTNKAAGEMRERVNQIAGFGAKSVWVATFHSTCVRILRNHADKLGYTTGFSIYDTDDSRSVMKEVLKRLNIDSKRYPERAFLSKISSAKDKLEIPEDTGYGSDVIERQLATVYKAYQERLLLGNAMDFDDLIVKTVELFKNFPEILREYQDRFQYIMVDEYQDTNIAQFELIRLLAGERQNLCVVGDDDQSIYKFRGANIYNILNFESNFSGCKVIKLEENYRSTSQILDAANAVIKNNKGRKEKALWTGNPDGEKIIFKRLDSSYEEAEYIAGDIQSQMSKGIKYSDNAILYRTNMQSRALEEKLIMENIPYRIVGGTNFYQRMEIKDSIAYLRAINNDKDDISVLRIINTPRRGIGSTSIEKVMNYAVNNNISFYEALINIDMIDGIKSAAGKIKDFTRLIEEYKKREMAVAELIDNILRDSGYTEALEAQNTDEAKGRLENLGELISKAAYYEKENDNPTLSGFLEEVSLIADIDSMTDEDDRVLLMTLHAAKGLEFTNVYMSGLEEGIFPGIRAISSADDMEMEEERRLAYVGITRAKSRLVITSARRRMIRGQFESYATSRFVAEIPGEMLETDGEAAGRLQEYNKQVDISTGITRKKRSYHAEYKIYNNPVILQSNIEKTPLDYNEGDTVRHIKFGTGKVVSIRDGGRDFEVTVDFETAGTKKMFAGFAKLVKI